MKNFTAYCIEIELALKHYFTRNGFHYFCIMALLVVMFGWINPTWIAMVIGLLAATINAAARVCNPSYEKISFREMVCSVLGVLLGALLVTLIKI